MDIQKVVIFEDSFQFERWQVRMKEAAAAASFKILSCSVQSQFYGDIIKYLINVVYVS